MIVNIRRQLTLFVCEKDAITIEQIRQKFNPLQFKLIKSHVTLCREDEIENLEQVIENFLFSTHTEIVIEFGKVIRFDNGKGLLLSANTDSEEFQELRKQILIGQTSSKKQEPHITLMHPRNSICTDDIFEQVAKMSLPKKIKFDCVSLIEQKDGGKWSTIQKFKLKNN